MILILFMALLALSVIIMLMGYYTGDEPYFPVGLFFFFLLGLVILNGNLEYETGAAITTTNSGSISTTIVTTQYSSWSDSNSHYVGYFMTILGLLGFALSLYNIRKGSTVDG